MARLFDNILEDMDIAEEEEIYFGDGKAKARMLRKEMTDDDINHYAKVYGFEAKARRSVVTIIQWRKKDYWQLIDIVIGMDN